MLPTKLTSSHRLPVIGLTAAISLSAVLVAQAVPRSDKRSGEQVFQQSCASCHGAKGEGAKGYPKPLIGDLSVGQLARLISQTMPPGPKKCGGEDAQKVATYIHGAFYSPIAQARNKPARIELSRLTVRQYRNAVADLVGSFRTAARPDEKRGLRGEYFKSRRFRDGERVLERVDPEVRFDFGTATPVAEQTDPHT
ncbi:MAG TPA: cytochrome c, partial [Armatimonadota bacterium]|nr:cytochrome c [Armatimonadota bacterium]